MRVLLQARRWRTLRWTTWWVRPPVPSTSPRWSHSSQRKWPEVKCRLLIVNFGIYLIFHAAITVEYSKNIKSPAELIFLTIFNVGHKIFTLLHILSTKTIEKRRKKLPLEVMVVELPPYWRLRYPLTIFFLYNYFMVLNCSH